MLQMNREQVETTVHENKCDDLSAMFNMIMDSKREEKGKMLKYLFWDMFVYRKK